MEKIKEIEMSKDTFEQFKEALEDKSPLNCKIKDGFLYTVDGVLFKTTGYKTFMLVDGKWVEW